MGILLSKGSGQAFLCQSLKNRQNWYKLIPWYVATRNRYRSIFFELLLITQSPSILEQSVVWIPSRFTFPSLLRNLRVLWHASSNPIKTRLLLLYCLHCCNTLGLWPRWWWWWRWRWRQCRWYWSSRDRYRCGWCLASKPCRPFDCFCPKNGNSSKPTAWSCPYIAAS